MSRRGEILALLVEGTTSPSFALSDSHAIQIPVGGRPAPSSRIEALRECIETLAREHGFPDRRGQLTDFDNGCAAALFDCLQLAPNQATNAGVWDFITLVVLPDIGVWRFPDRHPSRFVGESPRNAFRRLWQRMQVLGDSNSPDPTGAIGPPLGEDELVNIFERGATLAAYPPLATAMVGLIRTENPKPRSAVMRDFAKRAKRVCAYVDFSCLDLEQSMAVLAPALRDAVDNVRAGGSTRPARKRRK